MYSGRRRGTSSMGPSSRRMGVREMKWFDTTTTLSPLVSNGTIVGTLSVIPQDTTESGRIGRRIKIHLVDIKARLAMPADTTRTNYHITCRFILYVDRQCNGVAATTAEVLQNQTPYGHYNLNSQGRFRILTDRLINVHADAITTNFDANTHTSTSKQVNFRVKKKLNLVIDFNSTAGAQIEHTTNCLGWMLVSDTVTGTVTNFHCIARIRYTD